MDKIVRTTKHIFNFANKQKLVWLEKAYVDYSKLLQYYIDLLYEELLPRKTFLSSKYLPKKFDIVHSWWRQIIYKQASEIVRGTIEADEHQKRQRYKKVYKYFLKKKRQKKFLAKHFHELNLKKYTKPVVKNVSMVLDQRCLNIQQGNSFDEFINITLPYFKEGKRLAVTVNYPIKLTKRDKKY